ncbi:MAG: MFS transporter [bacterium]|nr:MFS transporter [bacterium]MDE0416870.1 MFS transporter [bacterium]
MTSGRTRWDIVALALSAGYIVGMQVGKVPPALPMLQAELDLSRVIAGLVASSFYGIGAVFGVACGLLIDRSGARRMIVAGGAVMALASLAGGYAGNGTLLLATRIVEGFGFATITVAAPKLIIAAASTGMRRFALGVWGTYMPIGMALSLLIATALLGSIGWRGLWFLNAGLIVLFLLAFSWRTTPVLWQAPSSIGAAGDDAGIRTTLSRPGPWLFGVCFVLFSIQWLAVMTWLPTFLIETQGRSLASAALFTAFIVSVTALGAVAGATLMHRGAERWLLIGLAHVVMGICAATLFAPFTADAAKIPLALAFALAGGLLPAACLEGGAAHAPSHKQVATASGFVAQGAALGSVLGPPLLAAVTEVVGDWAAAWWTMLICPGVGLAAVIAVWKADGHLAQSTSGR